MVNNKDAEECYRVIKCFGLTEAEMWCVASSSSAAKQQPANQYVVGKPSNYKQHVLRAHTHKNTQKYTADEYKALK